MTKKYLVIFAGLAAFAALATTAVRAEDPINTLSREALIKMPAKQVFGGEKAPAKLPSRAIGSYARGCLAGAKALPIDGPAWQVMRLSRNRNWGHPVLIALVERLATEARASDGWNGLLAGDMSQPRGGPMLSGHASHQIGLDADIWLNPMPNRTLSRAERENISARIVVKDRKTIETKVWTEAHARLIRRAANYQEVERIFVHPPIKAELCRWATGDRSWLAKVRPIYGHNYHFHIRMKCPAGSTNCKPQGEPHPKDGTGCGDELAYWLGPAPWATHKPDPNAPKPKPPAPMTMKALPVECLDVANAP